MANENGEEEEERFGLCCFNGCKNECLKKTCNVVETTENETTFEEKCTDGFRQECHDETVSKCEMVVVTDVDGDNKKVETVLECKNVTETIDVTKTECYEDLRQECKPVAVSKCQKGTDKITIGKYISPPSSCNLYSLFSEMRNWTYILLRSTFGAKQTACTYAKNKTANNPQINYFFLFPI